MESISYVNQKRQALYVVLTVMIILVLDHWLKFHIKTNYTLGESKTIFPNWFELHFTENPGMAFGLTLGGKWGKIVLTLFRIIASGVIIIYIRGLIKEGIKSITVILISLILAGAIGNIIDSILYGYLFEESTYHYVSKFLPNGNGYAPLFMGKVVDMLYFPLLDTHWPEWVPIVGGNRFQFFRPVFNIADAAISIGVFTVLIFRNRLFPQNKAESREAEID